MWRSRSNEGYNSQTVQSNIIQWWFVNPGSDSREISLVRTKSVGTNFHIQTNGWFSNPENSLIRIYWPGTNVSGLTIHHCIYCIHSVGWNVKVKVKWRLQFPDCPIQHNIYCTHYESWNMKVKVKWRSNTPSGKAPLDVNHPNKKDIKPYYFMLTVLYAYCIQRRYKRLLLWRVCIVFQFYLYFVASVSQ